MPTSHTILSALSIVLLACGHLLAGGSTFPQPLSGRFVENKGQWASDADFVCQLGGALLGIRPNSIDLDFASRDPAETGSVHRVELEFVNSCPARLIGERQSPWIYNFLLGNDRQKWRVSVSAFEPILYEEIYEGVNVRVRIGDRGAPISPIGPVRGGTS